MPLLTDCRLSRIRLCDGLHRHKFHIAICIPIKLFHSWMGNTHTHALRKESRLKTKVLHWSGLYTLHYRFMYLRHASTQRRNTVTMATAVVSIEMALVACSLAVASLLVFLQGSWTLQESAVATMVSTKCLSLVEQKRIQWARERGEFEFSLRSK